MIRLGLCSGACITRDIPGVIAAALKSRLDAIEWAADVHVGAGDLRQAERTMIDTLTAGLTTACYSSIYRAGREDEGHKRFDALLATASTMQAPLLRIYTRDAGGKLEDMVSELGRLGDKAASRGITICLSFGRKTFLDGYARAKELVEAVRHDFVRLAWEDMPGSPAGEATAALSGLGRMAGLLLARSAARDGSPRPLAAEAGAWRERLAAFKGAEPDPKMGSFVFLGATRAEGVEGETRLTEDADALRAIVEEVDPRPKRR
jgi:hypothetical protein